MQLSTTECNNSLAGYIKSNFARRRLKKRDDSSKKMALLTKKEDQAYQAHQKIVLFD